MARTWLPQGVNLRQRNPDDEESARLQLPGRRLNPAVQIGIRVLIAVSALLVTAVIVYAERDCYADRGELGTLTFIDALYYATVSLSTTGYGDIAPVCESARLVNVLVITPLRFIFLILPAIVITRTVTGKGQYAHDDAADFFSDSQPRPAGIKG